MVSISGDKIRLITFSAPTYHWYTALKSIERLISAALTFALTPTLASLFISTLESFSTWTFASAETALKSIFVLEFLSIEASSFKIDLFDLRDAEFTDRLAFASPIETLVDTCFYSIDRNRA